VYSPYETPVLDLRLRRRHSCDGIDRGIAIAIEAKVAPTSGCERAHLHLFICSATAKPGGTRGNNIMPPCPAGFPASASDHFSG
jgi:hypothetical protein